MLRRIAPAVVAAAVVICCFVTPVAGQLPAVFVWPDSQIVATGQTVVLDIRVSSEVAALMGYNIAITFDPSILELTAVSEGLLATGSGHPTFFEWLNPTSTDSVHVNGAILGQTVAGPGPLIRLEFLAHAAHMLARADVRIAVSVIRDGTNADIAHEVRDGVVLVEAPIPVESSSWGRVKALFRDP